MNQAERKARIIGAETRNEMNAKAIYDLQQEAMEQVKRIERLETAVLDLPERACLSEYARSQVRSQSGFHDRVGKLEAALRDVARCLVDGKVDVDVMLLDTGFHRHRILGAESVQAMVEVYHRLKE